MLTNHFWEKSSFNKQWVHCFFGEKTIDMHVTWSFPTETPIFLKRPAVMVLIGVASMDRNIQTTSRISCAVSSRSFLETHGYTRKEIMMMTWKMGEEMTTLSYMDAGQDPNMDYESIFWLVHVSPYLDPIILSYTQIFWLFMKAPQPWRRLLDKRSKI